MQHTQSPRDSGKAADQPLAGDATEAIAQARTADGTAERIASSAVAATPVTVLFWAVAVLLGARLTYQFFASPLPDEAYYWLWGQRLDWSYYDHPPLQAWLQRLFHAAGAGGAAGLRASTWLTSAALAISLLLLMRPQLGARTSATVVVGVFASPALIIFTTVTFPDHLMLALLAVTALAVTRVLARVEAGQRPSPSGLYGAALCLGLAMLTKVNAVLFALGLLLMILATPRWRSLLRNPHFHAALALAAVLQLPVLLWNLGHDGEGLRYALSSRLTLAPAGMAGNLGAFLPLALLALSPFVLPALGRHVLRPGTGSWPRMAWWVLGVSLVFWGAMTALTPVHYYWLLPAWVVLLPLLLADLRRRAAFVAHLVTGCLVAVLFAVNSVLFPLSAFFGDVDDETSLLYGWQELAPAVQQLREHTGADFLLASDYRHGAILAFHTGDTMVEVISPRRSQFDLWFDEDARADQSALIVTTDWHPMTPGIQAHFVDVAPLSAHPITRFGKQVAHYQIWLGTGYIPRGAGQ